jgi:hypothetical protein
VGNPAQERSTTEMATEAKSPRELELERNQLEVDKLNAERSGVGVRLRVGQTRGKSPVIIRWEAFDDSKPDTLPTSIEQFMNTTNVKDEPSLVGLLIAGYNEAQYTAASDPLAEFVEAAWPPEAQTQFRLVVRNYSRGANVSLEDAVKLIKPGFEKQFAAPAPAAS